MTGFCVLLGVLGTSLSLAGCCTPHHAKRWEYKVVAEPHLPMATSPQEIFAAREKFLNELGKDGWILVTESDGRVFYLKRPLQGAAPTEK